jgi:D-glycero-alpha-D-manno-heptose-7-phosphate kinase
MKAELEGNNPGVLGELLHENWMRKRDLMEGISDPQIDAWYEAARGAGAAGGKLLGAGSGGFLMFLAPPDRHEAIAHVLSELRRVEFRFDRDGSQIVFYRP